jgi:hypothetical protein
MDEEVPGSPSRFRFALPSVRRHYAKENDRQKHSITKPQAVDRFKVLALDISGASQHDKWSVTHWVFHIVVKRPTLPVIPKRKVVVWAKLL